MSESVSRFCLECETRSKVKDFMRHPNLAVNGVDENVINFQCRTCKQFHSITLDNFAVPIPGEFADWIQKKIHEHWNNGFVVTRIVDPIEFHPPVGAKSIDEILPTAKRVSKQDLFDKYPWLL